MLSIYLQEEEERKKRNVEEEETKFDFALLENNKKFKVSLSSYLICFILLRHNYSDF